MDVKKLTEDLVKSKDKEKGKTEQRMTEWIETVKKNKKV